MEAAEVTIVRRIATAASNAQLMSAANAIDQAPPEKRERLIAAALALYQLPIKSTYDGPLCPAYPLAPRTMAARLALGESPASVTGLRGRDAHDYLAMGSISDPVRFILAHSRVSWPLEVYPRSVKVAYWLVDRWRNADQRAALFVHREQRIGGQIVGGAFIDRIDEVRNGDLRPSVIATFDRVGARLQKQMERSLQSRGEPLRAAPTWWIASRCARLINTGPDLVSEGRAMKHCVALYAPQVSGGRAVIVGLNVLGERTTVEIDRDSIEIRQHKGIGNATPSPLMDRALATMIKKWQRAKREGLSA